MRLHCRRVLMLQHSKAVIVLYTLRKIIQMDSFGFLFAELVDNVSG